MNLTKSLIALLAIALLAGCNLQKRQERQEEFNEKILRDEQVAPDCGIKDVMGLRIFSGTIRSGDKDNARSANQWIKENKGTIKVLDMKLDTSFTGSGVLVTYKCL